MREAERVFFFSLTQGESVFCVLLYHIYDLIIYKPVLHYHKIGAWLVFVHAIQVFEMTKNNG
jgi:hypothetical protein